MGTWDLEGAQQEALLSLRRELHEHPELSWEEHETSGRIAGHLEAMGLEVRRGVAGTGLIADIGSSGPTVALRADMDALPIQEETGLAFASKVPGVMHACGHDAHSSCLVSVARRLLADPPPRGRVRLLFQPAEELGAGAPVMIREGALDVEGLCGVYGLHFWSQMPTGQVSVVEGPMMGSVDKLKIVVKGHGGHGAEPHKAKDALVAASQLVLTLQTLVSRRLDPLKPAVLSIGKFEAGSAFNIIPEVAVLEGTIRTLDKETWSAIPDLLKEVIEHSVASLGCSAQFDLDRVQMPLINHARAAQRVREAALEWVDEEAIGAFRTLAGEDFAAYLEAAEGAFFFVGAGGTQQAHNNPPHHNPRFWLDEEAFPLAVRLMESVARKALAESS